MTDEYDLPADVEAERWLLAAMLSSSQAVDAAVELLAPEHFYRPAHQVLFSAIVMMYAAGKQIDPVTLWAWVQRDGDTKSLGGPHGGEYVMNLYGIPAHPGGVPQYAEVVIACALRRRMAEEAQSLFDASRSGKGDPAEVMAAVADRIASVATAQSKIKRGSVSLARFMATPVTYPEPVIPGLLMPQDRVIVVGGEGMGKTTLGHQVGFAAAAGVHPFSWSARIPPQRVLIMDFENPELLLQRRFAGLIEMAQRYPGFDPSMIELWIEPGGIDLGSPRQGFAAAEIVRKFKPQLIVAGPLYKMLMESGDNPEVTHGRIARWFDRVRSEHGCALWIEHHAPLGGKDRTIRPMGSGVWSRWPEFGITLKQAPASRGGRDGGLDIGQFRGHRDESRPWPVWLTRNRAGGGWPWLANYPQGTLAPEPEEAG